MNKQPHTIWKRLHLILGLGTLSLSMIGCEHLVEELPPDRKTIEFAAKSSNRQSKAAPGHPIDGTDFPNGQSFGMYAYQINFDGDETVKPFMNPVNLSAIAFNNKEISKDTEGKVTYSPKIYWPNMGYGNSLRFFTYYPYNHDNLTVNQVHDTEQISITYRVPADPSAHIDLMYWMSQRISSVTIPIGAEFNHALTRLKFEAHVLPTNDFPEDTKIRITRIEIRDMIMEGNLRITPNGNNTHSEWYQSNTSKGSVSITTANGLRNDDYQIPTSTTPLNVLDDNGDLLVIPQDVAGLTMEVTVDINGVPKTYSYDLTQTANTSQWDMNQSITYQLRFSWDGITVTPRVADWNDVQSNVILDGQYYLNTTQTEINMGSNGGTATITLETNYDGLTGYDAGLRLDASQTVADGNWCRVSMSSNTGGPGIYKHTVTIATENTSLTRNTSFTVSAGNMTYKINVRQAGTQWVNFSTSSLALDGTRKSFTLESVAQTNPWTIKSVSDPYGILLPETTWEGQSGSNGTLYFYFTKNAVSGRAATITVGGVTDATFTITAL